MIGWQSSKSVDKPVLKPMHFSVLSVVIICINGSVQILFFCFQVNVIGTLEDVFLAICSCEHSRVGVCSVLLNWRSEMLTKLNNVKKLMCNWPSKNDH